MTCESLYKESSRNLVSILFEFGKYDEIVKYIPKRFRNSNYEKKKM